MVLAFSFVFYYFKMKGYMYILECCDGSYYVGSTNNLDLRIEQHNNGEGANHTRKRIPVELVYYEEFDRIDEAFYREKQVQGWSRKKKEALIRGDDNMLYKLSECKNGSHHLRLAELFVWLRLRSTDICTLPCGRCLRDKIFTKQW